ncbi:MAG: hypothetical protein OXU25_09655 [Thaumarchaeota archaeon]|nr:hypothetical protein [Nitrososphaerota archaeon]
MDITDLLGEKVVIAAGASASRETLERLRPMCPREMRDAVRRMFPGSPLAHMRPREVEGMVDTACLRAGLVRARVLGQPRASLTLADLKRAKGDPWRVRSAAGPGAARLPRRVLGGTVTAVPGPTSLAGPRRARVAPRRASRKRGRAAARGRVLGLPWLQATGILFGMFVGAAMVTVSVAQLFR